MGRESSPTGRVAPGGLSQPQHPRGRTPGARPEPARSPPPRYRAPVEAGGHRLPSAPRGRGSNRPGRESVTSRLLYGRSTGRVPTAPVKSKRLQRLYSRIERLINSPGWRRRFGCYFSSFAAAAAADPSHAEEVEAVILSISLQGRNDNESLIHLPFI